MDSRQKAGLVKILNDSVIFDAAMNAYCSYRAGGKAESICFVRDLDELVRTVFFLDSEDIPRITVGKGSNLLVTDKGLEGAVIVLGGRLAEVNNNEGGFVTAGGGISNAELLSYCTSEELSGLEFMAGIPGSLGGSVFMNAGACGEELGSRVEKAGVVNAGGKKAEIDGSGIDFDYRKTSIPADSVLYSVTLKLDKGKRETIKERIKRNLKKRKESQPLDMPSCGSVFKNPPGNSAGKLIEDSGFKGMRKGGAMVSPKHANFIVNTGNATASDITALIELIREKVEKDTGIVLETEIKVIGL